MWSLFQRNARQAKPARRTPHSYRPRLEVLEDRCLLNAGTLDPTFGNGAGYVTSSLSPSDQVNAVAVQPNGQIVIAGSAEGYETSLVARYNANGSLDTSFGTGGYATTSFNKAASTQYEAVAIQPNGEILTAGMANINGDAHFAVARYNTNGTLDTTFGTNGEVVTSLGGTNEWASSIAVQANGTILVSGTNTSGDAALVCYNANGSLDTTFGNGGILVTNIRTYGNSLVIQPDGQIVLAGVMLDPTSGKTGLGVALFNANGTIDSSFGNDGEAVTNVGSEGASFGGVVLQADSKIVVSGNALGGTASLSLVRYNADGTLDTTFGTSGNGIVAIPTPAGFLYTDGLHSGVEIQSNGQIIATAELETSSSEDSGAARVNADGTLDTSYGNGGWAAVPIGYGDEPDASALQPDGRLLLAGFEWPTSSDSTTDVALIRLTGDTTMFAVTGFPSTETAGTSGTFTVTVQNADGSTDTGYTGTVQFTSSDPQGVLPADYTFTAADQGVHTFTATLLTAGSQSLTATDTANGILGSETGITVNPAAASTLSLVGFPSPTNAGVAGSFTVTALDPYGNQATGYTGTVQFTSSDPQAVLPANYTFTAADNGTHTFSATLNTTGTQSLTATDTSTASISGSQTGITVNPASLPATSLSVTGFPTSIAAGMAGTVTVTARDINGNIATSYTGTVHFSSSDPLAVLPANYTFTAADQGVHTFTITLKKAGSQSITATDTATGSITGSQTGITVTPGAAAKLVLSAPSSVKSGSKFSLTVTVEDAYGNVVTGFVGTIHFTSSDNTATLPANYTFTAADAGVHTFTNTFILKKKGTQTLTVTDTQNSALTATDSIQVS